MSTAFVVLYTGASIASARIVAASSDPVLVADVSSRLLREQAGSVEDPAVASLERGRRAALRVIRREAADAQRGL